MADHAHTTTPRGTDVGMGSSAKEQGEAVHFDRAKTNLLNTKANSTSSMFIKSTLSQPNVDELMLRYIINNRNRVSNHH